MNFIQVQHADYASHRESNHDVCDIDTSIRCMSRLKTMMRWACQKSAEQDDNSN